MKIWVIGRSYPQSNNKMKGSFELEQAKMLAKAGHNVFYLAVVFHPFRKVKKWGFCDWIEDDVHICCSSHFYMPERMHFHFDWYQDKVWCDFIEKVERIGESPDVIHVHYPAMITRPNIIIAYQKQGIKIIATEHWSKILTKKIDNYVYRQLSVYVNNADAFICVGASLRDSVKEITRTKKNIEVIPNVVSSLFVPKNKLKNDKFNFIAMGRLVPVKQFDKIISAFVDVFREDKNVTMTIIGDGSEYKYLKQMIKKNNMTDQIIMTGALNRNCVAERLEKADALICYSQFETFGVPIIEAWACGLPVIASDGIGFLDYWNDDLGYVVPWDDIDLLKNAMISIKMKYAQYDSKKIADFAQENFGEKVIIKRLLEIYD